MEMEMEMEMEVEMEKSLIEPKKKLGIPQYTCEILKKALKFPFHILYLTRRALPLICTVVLHDLILFHMTALLHSRFRQLPIDTNKANWVNALLFKLIKLNFSYIIPMHLLIFVTAMLTTFFTSKGRRLMKLREIAQPLDVTRRWRRGHLIRLFTVPLISFVSYSVLVSWLFVGLMVHSPQGVYLTVVGILGFIVVLLKQVEFNGTWNMGVSVLEEKHEFDSLSISKYCSQNSRVRGLIMVLLHFYVFFSTTISAHVRWNAQGIIYVAIVVIPVYIGLIWKKMI